jgi:catechol 2,3-dioxygenase-like lactoylglutathione lyase family enzyme
MTMNITRMNHAAVNAEGKVAEARAFYVDLLGIPEVPIQLPGMEPVTNSDLGFWLEKEGVQMHVIGRESMGDAPDPTQSHVSWFVEDIEVVAADLAAREVHNRTMGEGDGRIIWILDPSGNVVEFQQDPNVATAG